tara:strand:- start:369 stop:590 length:222 start_codon:yes stop_codon:yes gene_type:complete
VSEDEKIDALHKYINTALKQDVLLETVYTAFKLQQRKGYDIDKAFRESLWSWVLWNSKNSDKVRVSDVIDANE